MTIRIDRVSTRGGDGGETSLGDGTRVAKNDARIEAMGAVDEANAVLGRLRAMLTCSISAPGSASRDRSRASRTRRCSGWSGGSPTAEPGSRR